MRARVSGPVLLALLACLAGCKGSVPPRTYTVCMSARPCYDPGKDPYWENPKFETSLLDAVQSVVHDPVDAADMSTRGLHATVKFTYLQGAVEYPTIVTSTGDAGLDELMLHQLASAQLPKATGLRSDEAHEFELDVDMPTPFETFQSTIYKAIDAQKVYPKDAVIYGIAGDAEVGFDYLDGKASGIAMTRPSKYAGLNTASLGAVTRATFPRAPAAYAGKTLHMQVLFCYAMTSSEYGKVTQLNTCPAASNVIRVEGERFRQNDVRVMPSQGDHG